MTKSHSITLTFVTILLIAIFSSFPLLAEEEEDGNLDFMLSLALGVEAFDGVTYQKVGLSPDLAIGKFGIGLDITIHYRFENSVLDIREEDWVPAESGFSSYLGLYLSKFKYVRYGFKGDPLYAKFGSIDDGVLGNGFIMGSYSNTLFLPERRIFGLSFDLDGALFNFPIIGMETFVGDLSAFDVIGARLFIRPLIKTGIPLLQFLQIGTTVAADLKPFRYADAATIIDWQAVGIDTAGARVFAAGVDFRQPILDKEVISLAAFGDLVTLQGSSFGGMLGMGGRLAKVITYGAQLRFLGENFVPVYFDSVYDISRPYKYALISDAVGSPSFIGWFASLGTSLLDDALIFSFNLDGPFKNIDSNPDNYLNYPHFRGLFMVEEGLIPGFSFDASYDKSLIRSFADFIGPEGALMRARINYHTGPAVISFFYQLRYTENDWTSDPEVTSGLETSIQLF